MAESVVPTGLGFLATVTETIGNVQFQKEGNGRTKESALAEARNQLVNDPYYQQKSQKTQ